MKREFLRGLGVEEDHIKKILDEHHDALQVYKDKAEKFDSFQKELDKANNEISKRDKQITDLESKVDDKEALENQLEEYKNTNSEYKTKMKELRLDNAIKVAVAKDAVNVDHVLKLINKEGLELNDKGTVKGLDKRLEGFREENAHLFEMDKPTGKSPREGSNPVQEKPEEQWKEFLN
ncbi:phage scaffolding protein [Staphylococcus equorum]|uniref:phage scaffolding protein n=1 Tax=Staphylococcus equorum TaxID=246432 RepID=UPI000D1C612B|nr:phage scaffolding protein [Staphylococcus equorum]PTE43378.1 hypothetical protein BUY77_05635 [Staphylococcus equorum]RIL48125.1 hypothetical protein BUY82_06240 [Staphylococcus equorum]